MSRIFWPLAAFLMSAALFTFLALMLFVSLGLYNDKDLSGRKRCGVLDDHCIWRIDA